MISTSPSWRSMTVAVGRRFGLVHAVQPMMIEPGDPRIWVYGTNVPNYEHILGAQLPESGGAGLTREAAYCAALGEALERYSASSWEPEEVVKATYDDLSPDAVHPGAWSLFSESQRRRGIQPFEPFHTGTVTRWLAAESLITGRTVWVPAQFVSLRHDHSDPQLALSTSSGLAAAATYEGAVVSGLCELIERDATMISWLNRLPLPAVVVDDAPFASAFIDSNFGNRRLSLHLCDATSDIAVPVVAAFVLDEADPSLATVAGSACRRDPEAAAMKALVEAVQTRIWLRDRLPRWETSEPSSFSAVLDFADHVRLFGQRAMREHLDFLLHPADSHALSRLGTDGEAGQTDLEHVLGRVAARGLDVLVIDITTEDVADLGVRVVRVLVPGLVQLSAPHDYRMLGGDRLYDVPVSLGHCERRLAEEELNPVPHPYP